MKQHLSICIFIISTILMQKYNDKNNPEYLNKYVMMLHHLKKHQTSSVVFERVHVPTGCVCLQVYALNHLIPAESKTKACCDVRRKP